MAYYLGYGNKSLQQKESNSHCQSYNHENKCLSSLNWLGQHMGQNIAITENQNLQNA